MTKLWIAAAALAASGVGTGGGAEAAASTPVHARTQRGCLRIAHSVALMQGYAERRIAGGRMTARRDGVTMTVLCAGASAVVSASGHGAAEAAAAFRAQLRDTRCIDDCD